jgi:hypothetical protein
LLVFSEVITEALRDKDTYDRIALVNGARNEPSELVTMLLRQSPHYRPVTQLAETKRTYVEGDCVEVRGERGPWARAQICGGDDATGYRVTYTPDVPGVYYWPLARIRRAKV